MIPVAPLVHSHTPVRTSFPLHPIICTMTQTNTLDHNCTLVDAPYLVSLGMRAVLVENFGVLPAKSLSHV